jgi:hypothetical protein
MEQRVGAPRPPVGLASAGPTSSEYDESVDAAYLVPADGTWNN